MKKLEDNQLEYLFKDTIVEREVISGSKQGRVIEKLTMKCKTIFIKYGVDNAIQKEIKIYNDFLTNYENLPIPKLIFSSFESGFNILALEWLEGSHPSFYNIVNIESVFIALGKWATFWNSKIEEDGYSYGHSLSNFGILDKLITNNKRVLNEVLEDSLILLNRCLQQKNTIVNGIKSMPMTLDIGDLSCHNIILDQAGNVFFIDFESCAITPMVTLVEHLGENYESIPHKVSHIEYALETYLTGWNENSNKYISLDNFLHSQNCARIYYNLGKFTYWIERIVDKINIEETLEWIKQGNEQLTALLEELEYCRLKQR